MRRARCCLAALVAATGAWAAAPAGAAHSNVSLTVLATNDLHGQLTVPQRATVGGAPYLAAHLNAVRARNADVLFLDAGDMFGAGPGIARRFRDEPTIEAMNLMGLDAVAAGNHEFARGLAHLRRLYAGGCVGDDCGYRHDDPYRGADFATLSANVDEAATGTPVLPGWTLQEVAGVQVGIVGLTTTVEGRYWFDPPSEVATRRIRETVNPAVDAVVAAGADIVIVVWHEGSHWGILGSNDPNRCEDVWGPSWNLREHLHEQVDLVVDGHTHQAYVCDDPGRPLMTQAHEHGKMYTEIRLVYAPDVDRVVARSATNHWVTHDVAPDPDMEALIEQYQALGNGDAPAWADLDGDTLGDGYEVFVSGSDPRAPDTDGDGLRDDHEVFVHRTDPTRADTDRGGVDDGTEVAAGTSPRLFADDALWTVSDALSSLPLGSWTSPATR